MCMLGVWGGGGGVGGGGVGGVVAAGVGVGVGGMGGGLGGLGGRGGLGWGLGGFSGFSGFSGLGWGLGGVQLGFADVATFRQPTQKALSFNFFAIRNEKLSFFNAQEAIPCGRLCAAWEAFYNLIPF